MNSNSMTTVMTAAARPRFPHSHFSTFSMSGQVAATIMPAQIAEGRMGRMIQNVAAIKIIIHRTCRVIRVKSGGACLCRVISFPSSR